MKKAGLWIAAAGLNGLIATALFASASHNLKSKFAPGDELIFELAAQFHMIHALVILSLSILIQNNVRFAVSAAGFMQAGILLFSGSLYYRALQGAGSLGDWHWITPLGGLSFMIGWFGIIVCGVVITRKASRGPNKPIS